MVSQSLHILHRANVRTANFILDSVAIVESPETSLGRAFNAGKIVKLGEFEATLVVCCHFFILSCIYVEIGGILDPWTFLMFQKQLSLCKQTTI